MPAANSNSKHSPAWKEMTDHESLWGKIMSFLNKIYSWLTGSKTYSTTEQRDIRSRVHLKNQTSQILMHFFQKKIPSKTSMF